MISLRPRAWRDLFPSSDNASDAPDFTALLASASDADASDTFWHDFSKTLNPALEKPRARRDGVEIETMPSNKGAILSDAKHGVYLQITPEDAFLWEQMDGTHTQVDLTVAYLMKYKALAPNRVAALVEQLRAQGLLAEPADETFPRIQARLVNETINGRINKLSQTFLQREFAIGGVDNVLGRAYRAFGKYLYTKPAQILLWLIALSGMGVFGVLWFGGTFSVLGRGSLAQGAIVFLVSQILALMLHETAHAFTVKHFGRKVRRAGLFILFGLVGAFVDTTDIWPAGKRAQLWVTWAGPFLNLILGGIAAWLIFANALGEFAALAFQFALMQYALVVLNLTPFLRLDGYYLLSDWLGIPNLRPRATAFLFGALLPRLREVWNQGHLLPRFTREEKILLAFGILSLAWVANLLALAFLNAPLDLVDTFTDLVSGRLGEMDPLSFIFLLVGLVFSVLALFSTFGLVRMWITNIARALTQVPAWRVALVASLLALGIALIPDFLAAQKNPRAMLLYGNLIRVGASVVAVFYAWRLGRELAGSQVRLLLRGATLTAIVLLAINLVMAFQDAFLVILPPEIFPLLHSAALIALGAALLLNFATTFRLAQGPLGWMLLLWALVIIAFIGTLGVNFMFLTFAGHTLFASALLLHWQLAHRPLVTPRVEPRLETQDAAQLLAYAVASVVEQMTEALVEVSGKSAFLEFVTRFNTNATAANIPVWLTMEGTLGDQIQGTDEERAPHYRAALTLMRTEITHDLGEAFAHDAQAQAAAELPLYLRAVYERRVSEKQTDVVADDDDRVRLRLAGRRLAETLVIGCARVYGWALTNQALGAFNHMAANANWSLYLRGNGRLADDLRGDLLTMAQVYADALQDLLGRIAGIAGIAFVERGVVQVYDSLPWQVREVANQLLFSRLSWARRLNENGQANERVAFLRTVPLLSWLSPNGLNSLAEQIETRRIPANRVISAQGTMPTQILIIRRGTVQVVAVENKTRRVVEKLQAGSLIGARSLVEGQLLPNDYVTETPVEVWRIPRAFALAQIAPLLRAHDVVNLADKTLTLLARIPLFNALDASQRLAVANAFDPAHYKANEIVQEAGAPSKGFFIVETGELDVFVPRTDGRAQDVGNLGAGEFFGEGALLNRAPATETIRARTEVDLIFLDPDEFHTLLATKLAATLAQVTSRRSKEYAQLAQAIPV